VLALLAFRARPAAIALPDICPITGSVAGPRLPLPE